MPTWSADLELGHTLIDNDHKQLVLLVNELDYAIRTHRKPGAIRAQFQELMAMADRHFCHEERLMRQTAYPGFLAHKRAHNTMTRDLRTLMRRVETGEQAVGPELIVWLKNWLCSHIMSEDRTLAHYLTHRPLLSRIA